jgi:putative ABC transport system substrate-binding protein
MNRRDALLATVALALPGTVAAQRALTRIAIIDPATEVSEMVEGRPLWGVFLAELRKLGYAEGKELVISRWSGGAAASPSAYLALARKMVATEPAVIVVRSRSMLSQVAASTDRIPIVALGTIPPELRASLARPGKNVTGIHVSFDTQLLYTKQVEMLRSVVGSGDIGWLGPRSVWESIVGEAARKGAAQADAKLVPMLVESPVTRNTIRRAFADLPPRSIGALLISAATEITPYRQTIAELAIANKLPSLGNGRIWTEAGALLSYGTDLEWQYRRAAHYVDRVLKGTSPAVIPIEQPSKVEFIINAETAKALGVTIPQSILLRADMVIE